MVAKGHYLIFYPCTRTQKDMAEKNDDSDVEDDCADEPDANEGDEPSDSE